MYKPGDIVYCVHPFGGVCSYVVLYQVGNVLTTVSAEGLMNSVFPVEIDLDQWKVAAVKPDGHNTVGYILDSFHKLISNCSDPATGVTITDQASVQLQETSRMLTELLKPSPDIHPHMTTVGSDCGSKITISGKDSAAVRRLTEVIRNIVE
jgi:hypothetical protein